MNRNFLRAPMGVFYFSRWWMNNHAYFFRIKKKKERKKNHPSKADDDGHMCAAYTVFILTLEELKTRYVKSGHVGSN